MSRRFRPALIVAACLLTFTAASAQSLRERLAERRAARSEQAAPADHRQARTRYDGATLPAGTRVHRDLAYGADPAQRLDVYAPAAAHDAPIIVMVHGGAWRRGDKAMRNVVENKAARWLPDGIVFVSVNYPMLPAQDALAQADDVARALAYVQAHAGDWGGDGRRVVLMGHSAGAHLVALLAADPVRAEKFGVRPWLGTVSLDSAALDVEAVMRKRHLPFYDAAFGADPARWRQASPQAALTAGGAPMLLVCSRPRRDGSCAHSHAFADRAQALGRRASVLEQDRTHEEINEQLGLPGAYTEAVENFMASLDPALRQALATR